MPELNDVTQGSSPESALESAVASSPEAQQQAQEAQPGTAKQPVTPEQEEARIPYTRFKEKVDEANWYKQQLEQTIQQRQLQQPLPEKTEELGNTPEEREFWRQQRKIAKEEAEKVAQAYYQPIQEQINVGAREFARLQVKEFRQTHPDVKPNSAEEIAIAERISHASQRGFSLSADEAYWMVMGERGIRTAQEQGKQQVKQQMEAKKAANVENRSIPPTSSYTPQGKLSLRQQIEKNWDDMEAGKI